MTSRKKPPARRDITKPAPKNLTRPRKAGISRSKLEFYLPDIPPEPSQELQDRIEGVLPRTAPEVRARMALCLWQIMHGRRWRQALATSGMTWASFCGHFVHSPGLVEIRDDCQDIGARLKQLIREDEADRRAVEGWLEPVFSQRTGKQIGTIRRYSDKLLETQLKAGDPGKYSEKRDIRIQEHVTVAFESVGVEHAPQMKAIQVESATETLPDDDEEGND